MDNTTALELEQLLALSREMGELAAKGEWEMVVEREAVRREALEAFFAAPIPAEQAPAVAEGIREIMALDEQLVVVCQRAQGELVQLMGSVKAGQKMDAAYAQHR